MCVLTFTHGLLHLARQVGCVWPCARAIRCGRATGGIEKCLRQCRACAHLQRSLVAPRQPAAEFHAGCPAMCPRFASRYGSAAPGHVRAGAQADREPCPKPQPCRLLAAVAAADSDTGDTTCETTSCAGARWDATNGVCAARAPK